MKQYQLYSFEQWVESVGGITEAAALMGLQYTQVNRFIEAGAVLSKDGTVFTPSASAYIKNKIEVE